LRVPLIYNLRLDPYERANITSNTYYDWLLDHAFMLANLCRPVPGDLQGLSTTAKGSKFHDRSGAAEAATAKR
jgi:hypothetical protein